MYILTHTNVDGYVDTWATFDEEPTVEQLSSEFSQFAWGQDDPEGKAQELILYGEVDMGDSANTHFTLSKSN